MPGTSPSIVADGVWYIDLLFQDAPSLIAAAVLETDAGLVLIDPGPAATLGRLQQGLQARGFSLDDVHALLLTHIHLDHAGATGTLVRQQPGMPVYFSPCFTIQNSSCDSQVGTERARSGGCGVVTVTTALDCCPGPPWQGVQAPWK